MLEPMFVYTCANTIPPSVSPSVCARVRVYTCIQARACIYVCNHVCMCVCGGVCARACVRAYVCVLSYTNVQVHTREFLQACERLHACLLICMFAQGRIQDVRGGGSNVEKGGSFA